MQTENDNSSNVTNDSDTVAISPEDRELLGDLDPNSLTVDDFINERKARLELEEKNKHLYARVSKPKTSSQPLQTKSVDAPPDRLEEIDLRARGYNDDEISVLQKYGGIAALKDPIIMAGIDNMRAKNAAERAAIVEDTGGASDLERKFTHEQLKDMPLDEMEKLMPKAQLK